MGHDHAHALGSGSTSAAHRTPLLVAFGLTIAYMLVQLGTALATGSLALLSDAAHMGTDVLGLGMALAAVTLAGRPARPQQTFGAYRLEVLAALANGLLLLAVAGYVIVEALQRLSDPPEVPAVPIFVVASIGLVVNLVSFRLLRPGAQESINVRGAYLEVLGDLLGSVGVIVAAVVIWTTGWQYADPLVAAAIGLFILPRTLILMSQALRILMEVAPPGLDVERVRHSILALPGVSDVHDLHVWTVTSGMDTATGHVVLQEGADFHGVLDRVTSLLEEEYAVTHATIQCEPEGHRERGCPM